MIQLFVPSQETVENCLRVRHFIDAPEDCVNPFLNNDDSECPDTPVLNPVKAYVEIMPFHKAIATQYAQQEAQFAVWLAMIRMKKIEMEKMQKRPGHAILNIFKRHNNHDVEIQDLDACTDMILSFTVLNSKLKNLPKVQSLINLEDVLVLNCDPLDIFTECTMRNFLLYILENRYHKEFGVTLDYLDKLNELKEKGFEG